MPSGRSGHVFVAGGAYGIWVVDTVDDEAGRGVVWRLDGLGEALAAVAGRPGDHPVHGRDRRLVALPALGTGWGGAVGRLVGRPVGRSAGRAGAFSAAFLYLCVEIELFRLKRRRFEETTQRMRPVVGEGHQTGPKRVVTPS